MQMLTKIQLTPQQICGNPNGSCILLEISEWKEFVDGKATDNVVGVKLGVVCPDNMYEKLTVKVKGKVVLTNEQLQQKGGQLKIAFKNLTGKFYRTNSGEYGLSCSADGFEVVS